MLPGFWKSNMAQFRKVVLFALIKNGKILLERRPVDGFSKAQYLIPGGAINEDLENLEQALKREMNEELGVIPTKFKLLFDEDILGSNNNLLKPFIVTSWTGQIPENILDKEDPHPLQWIKVSQAVDKLPILASKKIITEVKKFLAWQQKRSKS